MRCILYHRMNFVENVRHLLTNIFDANSKENWKKISPNDVKAATLAPLSHARIIEVHGHNCWMYIQSISGPLFSYQHCRSHGEADIRSFLIEPMIKELVLYLNCLSESPPQGEFLFRSTLTMEYPMELHASWEQ